MRSNSLAKALPLFVALLVAFSGLVSLAQQPDPTALPDWYNLGDTQKDMELLKDFVALDLKPEEWPQFAQLWQQFRMATTLQDKTIRTQLGKLRLEMAKADSQEAFDRAAGQLNAIKEKLQPAYDQALDATVQAVKNLLGPARCERLEVKNTLFDWARGVIETSRKVRKDNPTAWETIREDIIGSLSDNSSAGLEVFPVSEVRFWLNDISTMSDTAVEQRKWELYTQFANWMWPKSMVDMALDEVQKKDHVGEYLKSVLQNPMMPYTLPAKLAAVTAPPSATQ